MKISAGISEIRFNSPLERGAGAEKIFLWPAYNSGSVEKIRGVRQRTDSDPVYFKPAPAQREKILSQTGVSAEPAYTSGGRIYYQYSAIPRGSLFDAIA